MFHKRFYGFVCLCKFEQKSANVNLWSVDLKSEISDLQASIPVTFGGNDLLLGNFKNCKRFHPLVVNLIWSLPKNYVNML